jgi:mannosyltransferase
MNVVSLLTPRHGWLLLALLIAAVGIGLRGWGIGQEPMWLDEAYSAYAASKGWAFLWKVVPRYETHPPFYYSLLRGWTLIVGDGLLGHRALGLACGIAALPVIGSAAYAAARAAGLAARALPIAVAAVALAAMSPILVEMSREVRPYPVMILVYGCACWALMRITARSATGQPLAGRAFAAYLATSALMLWLHNMGPLYAFAMGLALLVLVIRRGMTRADWLWLVGGHLIVLLVWTPALMILLDQAPTWIRSTWLKFQTANLWRRVTVIYAGPTDELRIAAALLLAGGVAALRRTPRIAIALLLLMLIPVTVSLILSATVAPVFIVRTMTALAGPGLVLMAVGAGGYAGPGLGRLIRWPMLAALLWMVGHQVAIDVGARQGKPMEDWHKVARWIAPRFRPGDQIFTYPNETALPLGRALLDLGLEMPIRAIPTDVPTLDPPPGSWYVSGSRGVPSLDRAHLRAIATEPRTRAVPTIWLVRGGPWAYDKGDVFVEELTRAGRIKVGQYFQWPADVVGLRRIAPADCSMLEQTRCEVELYRMPVKVSLSRQG